VLKDLQSDKTKIEKRLTQRALDRWESAPFSSIFLASSLYYSQAESTLTHLPVTQTVSWLEIGVSQMSGNKLMILKPKLPIETDNRATVGVPQEMMFYDTSNLS